MKYRTETDSIGKYKIPSKAFYGSQTKRSYDALKITNKPVDLRLIKSVVQVKKAEAMTYHDTKEIDGEIANAIIESCNDILDNMSKYRKYFITDQIQGGAGTSVNMNVNEVIANLSNLKLNKKLGEYRIHPNDHINKGQSTNDVFPTAGRITFLSETKILIEDIKLLQEELIETGKRFNIVRLGKTHLQDAVPIKMSKIFTSWASSLDRDLKRLENNIQELKYVNLGATAVGTGISQNKNNLDSIYKNLRDITSLDIQRSIDMIDGTRNTDIFLSLSNTIKTFITSMSKNCNDLRLLASGPTAGLAEIIMPELQPGSSIMPGKVNPIIPESINQIAFAIIGHNTTINYAVEAGQLELNVFEPIIFTSLFNSFDYSSRACKILIKYVLQQVMPNIPNVKYNIEHSSAYTTAFTKKYGYSKVSQIVHDAIRKRLNVKNELIDKLKISLDEYQETISPKNIFPLEGDDEK